MNDSNFLGLRKPLPNGLLVKSGESSIYAHGLERGLGGGQRHPGPCPFIASAGLRFMASENSPARTSEDGKGRQAAGWKMASVTAQGSTATLLPVGKGSGARPQGEVAQTFLCSLGLPACLACVPICLSHCPLPPTWSQYPYSVLQPRLGLPSPSPSP